MYGIQLVGMLVKTMNAYLVQVSVKGVTLQISRVKSADFGYYLGVYIIHSDGFSKDCHGIIGDIIEHF